MRVLSRRLCGALVALAAFVALAGCYRVNSADCMVTCGDADACPHGLTCSEGYCRTAGATGRCTADAVVTVVVTGGGTGQVTSTPEGIACPPACVGAFAPGTAVELRATPEPTTSIVGAWRGCAASSDTCTVTTAGPTEVGVEFALGTQLTVRVHGAGAVGSAPAGLACSSGTCVRAFAPGAVVALTATPATGSSFFGWAGACPVGGPCEVTLDRSQSVGAWFESGDVAWRGAFGGTGHDGAHAIAVDSQSNVIVAGSVGGPADFGGGPLPPAGGLDAFVAKLTPDGSHLWSRRYGAGGDDLAQGVAVDGDDNVIVAGVFAGTVDFGGGALQSAGSTDAFVVKLSATGEHRWSARFGGPGEDPDATVAVAPDGDVVLAGACQDGIDLGGGPLPSLGARDWFVGRFSPDGVHRWSHRFGGASDDSVGGVAVAPDGGVALAGAFAGSIDLGGGPLDSAGGEDIGVVLLDAAGQHSWSRRFGGVGNDAAAGVAVGPDGAVVLAGSFSGVVDFGDGPTDTGGGQDGFLLQLAADATFGWVVTFGGAGSAQAFGAAVDGRGRVVVGGAFSGSLALGAEVVASAGASDGFVASYAADGAHRWSRRLGGTGDDLVEAVAVDRRGEVLAGASFSGSLDLDDHTVTSQGGRDVLAVRMRDPLADQWARSFGGGSEAYSGAVDRDGNILVTGFFTGTIDFGGGPLESVDGGDDVFVVKLSPLGRHLWSRAYGGAGSDYGLNVAVDDAGDVVVTGVFTETVDFGDGPVASAGAGDVFVVGLDPAGGHRWSRTFGGPGEDNGYWLAVDAQRNVVAAGFFADTVDFGDGPRTSAGLDDVFVVKLGPGGAHLWTRTFGGAGVDDAYAVATTPSGDVAITGFFVGTVDFGGGPLESVDGSDDVFVTLLAPDGAHRWSRSFGGPLSDVAWSIAAAGDGSLAVTGHFAGTVDFGGGPLESMVGSDDAFILKLAATGEHVWSRSLGGASDATGTDVAVTGDGSVLVTGQFADVVDFGPARVASVEGSADVFVARLSPGGDRLWMQAFGGPGDETAFRIVSDGASLVLAGSFEQTAHFWADVVTSDGSTAVFVSRQHAADWP
jgi:hypothetical protein